MHKPDNPAKVALVWAGYYCHRFEWVTVTGLLVGVTVFGFLLGTDFWGLGIGGIALAGGVQAAYSYFDSYWKQQEDETAARESIMDDCLIPLIETLHDIPSQAKDERKNSVRVMSQQAAGALKSAFSNLQDVRVVVFEISDDGQTMSWAARQGRGDKPLPFERGTVRGDRAFSLLSDANNFTFEPDIENAEDGPYIGLGGSYNTFISAPIRRRSDDETGRAVAYGMISIDSPNTGDLDVRDGSTAAVFASILAVAYAEATR
ncbi:hypothetical protein [Arthrobacter sp. Br18]|uniref:hypothetical protein n=1 Tax=Arthrobacter sp. Br18 TaxID=1312954 RepID=UPI00047A4457|nr:hypothetical protein [Arthrobacter sp. Br18]